MIMFLLYVLTMYAKILQFIMRETEDPALNSFLTDKNMSALFLFYFSRYFYFLPFLYAKALVLAKSLPIRLF